MITSINLFLDADKINSECIRLIRNHILAIQYPKDISALNWDSKVKAINIPYKKKEANVYCILILTNVESNKFIKIDKDCYELKYIGKSESIHSRLGQHLKKCPQKTNSCIDNVKKYILEQSLDKKIYISGFKVEPEAANSYVETLLQKYFFDKGVWYKRKS